MAKSLTKFKSLYFEFHGHFLLLSVYLFVCFVFLMNPLRARELVLNLQTKHLDSASELLDLAYLPASLFIFSSCYTLDPFFAK